MVDEFYKRRKKKKIIIKNLKAFEETMN